MKFATLIKTKKNMKNKPEPDNPLPDSGWSRIRALLDPLQLLGIKQDPVCLAEEWRKLEQVNARLMERDRRWDALYQAGGGKVSDRVPNVYTIGLADEISDHMPCLLCPFKP